MMSLAEIPQNHVRRNANVKQSHDLPHQSRLQTGLHSGNENLHVAPKPSPVQSMLKTSTETGDVGQFNRKPPRGHIPASHFSPLPKSTVRAASGKRPRQIPIDSGKHGYSGLQNAETLRQGGTAPIHSTFHARGHTRPYQRPSFEDYTSPSRTQGAYNSHSLTYRGPPTNVYHYRRDVSQVRPRSPYTYTTRLKRLGYRPSSPALGDINKPAAIYSRTASPLSAHNTSRTPSPFRYVVNRSDPNLEHYPPYLSSESKQYRSPSASSKRRSIPRPPASVTSSSSSSRVYQRKSITNMNWAHPKLSVAPPVFYDYTEDFQDSNIATRVLNDQQIPTLGPATYSESDGSPVSNGEAELSFEDSIHGDVLQTHEPGINRNVIDFGPPRDNTTATAPQDLSDVPEQPEKEMAATYGGSPLRDHPRAWTNPQHSLDSPDSSPVQEPGSLVCPLSSGESVQVPKELAGEVIASNVTRLSDQGSTSPTVSMFSVKSSESLRPPRFSLESVHDLSVISEDRNELRSPMLDVCQQDILGSMVITQPLESLRGPSFEGHSKNSTEILSPTPDRSILSPSSRERFSRILSMNDDLLDAEPLEPPPKREERMETPTRRVHSIDAWGNRGTFGAFRYKRSPNTRSNPLKQSITNDPTIQYSDSEDEPELTVGLRQTFCKDKESMIELRQLASLDDGASGSACQEIVQHSHMKVLPAHQELDLEPLSIAQRIPGKRTGDVGSLNDSPRLTDNLIVVNPIPDVDKELHKPPRKQPSFRSYSPPIKPRASQLPLDFTALVRRSSEDESHLQLHTTSPVKTELDPAKCEGAPQVVRPISEAISINNTSASPPSSLKSRPDSRPWNHDSNYPWNDELPGLDVTMPQIDRNSSGTSKPPRFKLRIQRPSSSIGRTSKLRNEVRQSGSLRSPFASSFDLGSGQSFRRKRDPKLSVGPGQINSSHDVMNTSRQKTRFVDTFEPQSPGISLQLPSPNHEVRSFFSDDSSDIRPRGVFRKRLSEFRARATAARGNSVDETHGYDRGLLSSALGRSRASGRSSRQSQTTAGASIRPSIARRVQWKMMDKIRTWVHRGEDRVRDWKWKMRYRRGKNRAASAPLYSAT